MISGLDSSGPMPSHDRAKISGFLDDLTVQAGPVLT